jgi:hydroxyproline O-arabinosyltransferase
MSLQGGFTRVLHSGKADDLMDEIPTFVADPLPKEKHNNGGYVVINRPYAFVQWTSKCVRLLSFCGPSHRAAP